MKCSLSGTLMLGLVSTPPVRHALVFVAWRGPGHLSLWNSVGQILLLSVLIQPEQAQNWDSAAGTYSWSLNLESCVSDTTTWRVTGEDARVFLRHDLCFWFVLPSLCSLFSSLSEILWVLHILLICFMLQVMGN